MINRNQLKTILISAASLVCTSAQLVRQSNSTMQFPAEPVGAATGDPTLTDLFTGALKFDRPVAVRSAPNDPDHLYVVERAGRIIVVDLNNPVQKVFLDITDRVTASAFDAVDRRGEGLTSFDFHPDFQQNGRFFVTYTFTPDGKTNNWYDRISEFHASGDRSVGLTNSEIPYVTQFDEGPGHNVNDAHFGPDGYLYVAIGDEGDGGTGDDYDNAQKIDKDFFSCVMRIDVDKRPGNLPPNPHPSNTQNYWIPADNPFVGATSFMGKPVDPSKVRTEFWAVGFRNAWRISFDPLTGEMYEGDVGQHTREEINHVVKGGNYGWSFFEGTAVGPKGPPPPGFLSVPPLWEYSTGYEEFSGMCVTGGVVYRGSRIPQLFGNLIFADYASANVWALNIDQPISGPPTHLFTQKNIAGFGYDPRNGDVLMVDHDDGIIWRLDVSGGPTGKPYPETLSDAGIFSDLSSLQPNPGIVPYDVNVPFWSDGAIKRRWFSVPDGQKIQFSPEKNWTFPAGSIWIKHFDLQTNTADSASAKRVETRVLVKTKSNVYGLSYQWDDAGVNATLVPESGTTNNYTIMDSNGMHQQTWRFPSRSECLQCHTLAAGFVLGFTTAQMNRSETYGEIQTNQIAALANAGFLDLGTNNLTALRALAPLTDESVSRTYRVRSYLAANCSQCHRPGTGIQAAWDARLTTTLPNANILNGNLYNNPDGSKKVVIPGDLDHSAMFRRISVNDKDRMPPVGSTVLDQQAIALLHDWISQDLPNYQFLSNDTRVPIAAQLQDGKVALSFSQPANRSVLIESATSMQDPVWQLIQVPDNAVFFPAKPSARSILDLCTSPHQYYRLRVTEP